MKVALVSTSGNDFPYHGPVIRARTKGKANHSLIRFTIETQEEYDAFLILLKAYWVTRRPVVFIPGMMVYFESYWRKDMFTGRTGVRGPIPWNHLTEWEAEKKSNKLYVQELPFDQAAVGRGLIFCIQNVGKITYPHYQLLQSLLGVYWKLTEEEAFCSEFAAMVIRAMSWEVMEFVLRGGHVAIDMVTPDGKDTGLMSAVTVFPDMGK